MFDAYEFKVSAGRPGVAPLPKPQAVDEDSRLPALLHVRIPFVYLFRLLPTSRHLN